jgi:HEPN domain-containing protein
MSAHPVDEWIKKAEDNHISALDLAKRRRNSVPDVVCNHCQQCAEKYVKALLVRHQIEFPKTHDLPELGDLLIAVEPDIRLMADYLHALNPYGIDIRYPGSAATIAEAKEAIKAMKAIRKFVRAKLGLRTK